MTRFLIPILNHSNRCVWFRVIRRALNRRAPPHHESLQKISQSFAGNNDCRHGGPGFYRLMSTHKQADDDGEENPERYIPVTIVGGGPVGLLLSNLLSSYQVPSLLLEAKPLSGCFQHPQAHFLNTRTMEILRTHVPHIYKRVLEAMPPKQEYQQFCFGYNVVEPNPLATVLHPVQHPLQLEQDANGTLLPTTENKMNSNATMGYNDGSDDEAIQRRALSPCTVGHLAQHKFSKILYEEAMKAGQGGELQFETRVERVETTSAPSETANRRIRVYKECGKSWLTDLCVAVDGANSTLRQAQRLGQFKEQFLVNVYVKLTKDQCSEIPHKFMLYTVLNETIVAMLVSHGEGEYVLQIPYFPPYQDFETDFPESKVVHLVSAVFGFPISASQIMSVRPWTMTSWVASRYHNQEGLVWAGDAAHAFPPAGGFGMNTGLQDVHNLAWRIYKLFDQFENTDDAQFVRNRNILLDRYEEERQPIAMDNAALSVRNYDRVLAVMNECYLNHKHPDLAKDALDGMKHFVPLSSRKDVFRSLIKTALQPLAWLRLESDSQYATSSSVHGATASFTTTAKSTSSPSLYRQHVQSNLRQLLTDGGGLPLLFPNYEIGFSYRRSDTDDKAVHSDPQQPSSRAAKRPSDTFSDPYLAQICVGQRLPHAWITPYHTKSDKTVHGNQDWNLIDLSTWLTASSCDDTPGTRFEPACVVLVLMGSKYDEVQRNFTVDDFHHWEDLRSSMETTTGFTTHTVYLYNHKNSNEESFGSNLLAHSHVIANTETTGHIQKHHIFHTSPANNPMIISNLHGVALIRPDSHVAAHAPDASDIKSSKMII